MSGWKLSLALVNKHFGKLGDSMAEALASFDPETATEVDREKLQEKLREVALKLSEARRNHTREQKEADDLAALIATDEKAVTVLIAKFEKGEIDEATLNEFADNLEAEKARLPAEKQEADEAKELVDTLQEILATVEQRLAEFDNRAKAATRAIAQAKADKERADLRLQHQNDLRNLQSGLGDASSALNALNRRAEQLRVDADATQTLAVIGQKPVDRANAVEEARRIAAGGAAPAVSAVDRLRRLAGQ